MLVEVADVADQGPDAGALPLVERHFDGLPSRPSVTDANALSQYFTDSSHALRIAAFVASPSKAFSACGDFSPLTAAQKT